MGHVCSHKHTLFVGSHNCLSVNFILHRLNKNSSPLHKSDYVFEMIAEFLNILRVGDLSVVGSTEIPPSTDIVKEYFIQHTCFSSGGTVQEFDVLDIEGVCCSACSASRKDFITFP